MSILFSDFFAKNNVIRPQEADFTEVLASIALVPKMLYFYGKIPQNRLKTVAIVGTRKFTNYGENVAYELAYTLAKCGVVVVSGLAYGIDSIAHRGALDAGGITIAILGTPIDQIYPKEHLGLAKEIVEKGGAVMSEVAKGEIYYPKTCFLKRNRIIAGLADAVIIVEAAERSGSLNTAAHAVEQGKEVFAVPGDITRPMSRGCNQLINEGANVYTGAESVLEVLFPRARRGRKPKMPSEAQKCSVVRSKIKTGQSTLFEVKSGARGQKMASQSDLVSSGSRNSDRKAQNAVGRVKKTRDGQVEAKGPSGGSNDDKILLRAESEPERVILQQLMKGASSGSEILRQTGLTAVEFNRQIAMLEVKGLVMSTNTGEWRLKRV